ncbi:MAG: hypothetical protein FJ267_19210, partial [Planctomycetes bacterium]|nr:hypothetical protein [Planctomycetota bacterium]
MDLGIVFKRSLYGMMAIVGWILGAAEHQSWIPYLSIPIAIAGYFFCESRTSSGKPRWHGLNDWVASGLGIVALFATSREFLGEGLEGKLLSGTHLLVYLTWIVLIQYKSIHRCWLLMALGVLQIAVASVLVSGGWFGLCVFGYIFSSIWTLSVFSLYRAEQRFYGRDEDSAERPFNVPASPNVSQVFGTIQFDEQGN